MTIHVEERPGYVYFVSVDLEQFAFFLQFPGSSPEQCGTTDLHSRGNSKPHVSGRSEIHGAHNVSQHDLVRSPTDGYLSVLPMDDTRTLCIGWCGCHGDPCTGQRIHCQEE